MFFLIPVINRQLLNAIRRVSELEMEQATGEGRGERQQADTR